MRGSTGLAPIRVLDEKSLSSGGQRWRFLSLRERLDNTSARPSLLPSTNFEQNLEGVSPDDVTFSHFSTTLSTQCDDNITASFTEYAETVRLLSLSLPLVFRNRKRILDVTLSALQQSANSTHATTPLSACLAALAKDLGTEHLHPYFSYIIKSFADILTITCEPLTNATETPQKGNPPSKKRTRKAVSHSHAAIWDPQSSLIPLFSTLAEITRILLTALAAKPEETVSALYPLLAHSNYRVRGMTAEACLGYIIRKTRDDSARRALVEATGRAAPLSNDADHVNACDGLGMSLFEAVRLPAGRLHTSAVDVISATVNSLRDRKEITDDKKQKEEDCRLMVVSRCFAAVVKHVQNQEDAQSMFAQLASEGNMAKEQDEENMLADVMFLLRKCTETSGARLCNLLGAGYLHRLGKFVSSAMEKFNSHPRIAYEATATLIILANIAPEKVTDSIYQTALRRSMGFVAQGAEIATINVVLSLIVNKKLILTSGKHRSLLMKATATMCEELAKVSIEESNDMNTSQTPSVSSPALLACLQVLHLFRESSNHHELSEKEFCVPTLNAQIQAFLTEISADGDDMKLLKNESAKTMFTCVLDYISQIYVSGLGDILSKLATFDNIPLEDVAKLLITLSRYNGQIGTPSKQMDLAESRLTKKLISHIESSPPSLITLAALRTCITGRSRRTFSAIECFNESSRGALHQLSLSLCSKDRTERIFSADLLSHIFDSQFHSTTSKSHVFLKELQQVNKPISGGEGKEERDEEEESQTQSEISFSDFFRTCRLVLEVSRSLQDIDKCMHLIQGLSRNVRVTKQLPKFLVTSLIYFCGGVLRTPVQTLWKGAGELWSLVATHDKDEAMAFMMSLLKECESQVISDKDSQNTSGFAQDGLVLEQNGHIGLEEEEEINPKDKDPKRERRANTKKRLRGEHDATDTYQVISKRPRKHAAEYVMIRWNSSQWQTCTISLTALKKPFNSLEKSQIEDDQAPSTDNSTFFVELLKVLAIEPKNTIAYRLPLIQVYLNLNLSLFSRRTGIAFGLAFTSLLEKMGGLKCTGNDFKMETALKSRLLSDITRPNASLQVSSLRCLCASRSPHLKPHRESFIRLIESSTFREELTLITDSFLSESNHSAVNWSEDQRQAVTDMLVRICFSKMKAKNTKASGNKSAVLSFLVSKLPPNVALPRLCSLALEPLSSLSHSESEANDRNSETGAHGLHTELQRGVLSSLEAIVDHCRRSLPEESWKKIAQANLVLLKNAGKGSNAQTIRSRTLRLLSSMQQIRPAQSNFVLRNILQAVQDAGLENMDPLQLSTAPAFLKYASTVYSDTECSDYAIFVSDHAWVTKFCLKFMRSEKADVESINLSLRVAKGILQYWTENGNAVTDGLKSSSDGDEGFDICANMAQSLECLLGRLVSRTQTDRTLEKMWSSTMDETLSVIISLSRSNLFTKDVMITLAKSLIVYLKSPRPSSTLEVALNTLNALCMHICESRNKSDDKELIFQFQTSIQGLIPLVGNKFLLEDRKAYAALCHSLRNTGLPDLKAAAIILQELNCAKEQRLNSQDLDRAIDALNKIISSLKVETEANSSKLNGTEGSIFLECPLQGTGKDNTVAVKCDSAANFSLVHACIAAIRHEDTAIRGTAGYALKLMAKWCGQSGIPGVNKFRVFFLDEVVYALISAKSLVQRRECSQTLGEFTRFCDSVELSNISQSAILFPLLKQLSSPKNLDSDFFENLVHLQAHRRSRALRHLENYLLKHERVESTDGSNAIQTLASTFSLPLGMRLAIESAISSRSERRSKHSESQDSANKDVSTWAIRLVGASAKLLPWQNYKSCLSGLLRRLKVEDDESSIQILYKLLVHVSDAFPNSSQIPSEANLSICNTLETHIIPEMLKHVSGGAVEGFVVGRNTSKSQSGSKHQRKGHAIDTFQAPIAVAIGKLMMKLPEQNRNHLVPLLITPLSTALRSPLIGPRDSAKKALVQVVTTMGNKYFKYVTSQVLGALREGFRKDSCIYVVHALLGGIRDEAGSNTTNDIEISVPVDSVVSIIMKTVEETLVVGANESVKEYEDPNISASRQKKASSGALKAAECAEVLAEIVEFDTTASHICEPVFGILQRTPSSKVRNRAHEVLRRIRLGFCRNSSITAKSALTFCYSLVYSQASNIPSSSDGNEVSMEKAMIVHRIEEGPEKALFALRLLHAVLSKYWASLTSSDIEARELQAMIDPFTTIVTGAFEVGDDELSLAALQASQRLLKLPINGKPEMAGALTGTVIEVLSQAGVGNGQKSITGSELLYNTCLKSAAILFKESGSAGYDGVTKEKIDTLVTIACNNVERGNVDARNAAIALLRGVVGSRIITPAVYDAMDKVNNLAIHAQSSSMRASCTSLSISFLVSFPLGSKRVRQHLEFFVRNLNYPIASGRLASIEALQKVIARFPSDMLEIESEHLFIAITATLGRDEDSECKSAALKCVQLLFEKLAGTQKASDLLKMVLMFLGKQPSSTEFPDRIQIRKEVDPAVRRSGASAVTAAAKSGILTHAQRSGLFKTMVLVLCNVLGEETWETIYAFLHGLETLIETQDKSQKDSLLEIQEEAATLMLKISSLLTHQHQWVRLSASRLLGLHLSAVGGRNAKRLEESSNIKYSVWNSDILVRDILRALCLQLEANMLSSDLAQQSLKNILCMTDVVQRNPDYGDLTNEKGPVNGMDESELGNESKESHTNTHRALRWVLSRMSGIAIRVGDLDTQVLRRGCALRFLQVTSKWWDGSFIDPYKHLYVTPVVRILESGAIGLNGGAKRWQMASKTKINEDNSQNEDDNPEYHSTDNGNLRALAEALQESLTSILGTSEYYKMYHEIKNTKEQKKEERKQQAALVAAIDPERAAKKRRRKAMVKKAKKHKSGHVSRSFIDGNTKQHKKRKQDLTEDL